MDESNKEVVGGIVLSVNITKEDIEDIMAIALEGGIDHWSDYAEVSGIQLGDNIYQHVANGGTIMLFDAENGDRSWTMSREQLLIGWQLAMQANAFGGYTLEDLNSHQDVGVKFYLGSFDAECADIVIQYALFGEVVFS